MGEISFLGELFHYVCAMKNLERDQSGMHDDMFQKHSQKVPLVEEKSARAQAVENKGTNCGVHDFEHPPTVYKYRMCMCSSNCIGFEISTESLAVL